MTELESKDALILHLERTLKLERQTLRDQFAMAALTGLATHRNLSTDGAMIYLAVDAYLIADNMMTERLEQ